MLKPDGYAITLQNGIGNIEALSEALGAKRVVGGISYRSAALEDLGHVNHTNGGSTFIGELDGSYLIKVKKSRKRISKRIIKSRNNK